ncbi:uncharacterized protein LOC114517954 [Dendronephthya gigantea]|uniref:uncharacterized protein LOC114517954 n=1 Tax=Dendronephthya gigantea TaxID=151771 RepID=UPI00106B3F38|nr:uncharacterized protein LOC114517954 [Dendronephthya gigantea]
MAVSVQVCGSNHCSEPQICFPKFDVCSEAKDALQVHMDKSRTGGENPSSVVPLLVFSDETSGNTTKKWNRLESFSMSMAGLTRKEFRKMENIHFLSTSNIVPSVALGKSIARDLEELECGKMMYDAFVDREILVKCPVLCVLADNPRASEFEHHLGSCANKFCRKCNATANNATGIQEIRTDQYVQEKIQEIQNCPSENQKKDKRSEYGVTEKGGAFDILKSFRGNNKTPIEILHTILLGPVKYMLSDTMKSLSQGRKEQLHAKIQALDMSAFPATIRGNITRNYGSYVGRDFKLWMQVAVFILEDIIPHEQLFVWELLSEIFALAYSSGFDKRNSEGAKQLFKTFVDAVTRIYPEFLKKAKLHLLLHLVDDIENLGPANGFSTER